MKKLKGAVGVNRLSKIDHELLVLALCQAVRDRRETLQVSQSELARRSGLHRSYIGDVERGSRNVSVKNLSRLATALELSASELMSSAETKLSSEGGLLGKRPSLPTVDAL